VNNGGSETFCVFEANFFFLVDILLGSGIVYEIRSFLLQNAHKMATNEEAVEQPMFNLALFDGPDQLHVKFRIDIVRLQLHFSLQRTVRPAQPLADQLSKGFDKIDLR
jgi:hypothetical protein